MDIVAHSMGGLIARVALLGSAQGWEGFPPKLDVNNVVTLSTPHGAWRTRVPNDDASGTRCSPARLSSSACTRTQARRRLGGRHRLEPGRLPRGRHAHYDSAIDKGDPADQKFGYLDNQRSGKVTHTGVRTLFGANDYHLIQVRLGRPSAHAHDGQRLVAAEGRVPGGHQGRRRPEVKLLRQCARLHLSDGRGLTPLSARDRAPGHAASAGTSRSRARAAGYAKAQ